MHAELFHREESLKAPFNLSIGLKTIEVAKAATSASLENIGACPVDVNNGIGMA